MSEQRLTEAERTAVAAGCAECGKELAGDEPIAHGLIATHMPSRKTYAFCSHDCADLFIPDRARLPRKMLRP